jgi:hypothetical protein
MFAAGVARRGVRDAPEGILLLTNWRLTLVQVLPTMWVWLAMCDLKAHVLRQVVQRGARSRAYR